MSCICLDISVNENPLCSCEMGAPILPAPSDLITSQASQFLVGLGAMLTSHPDLRSQLDEHTGRLLISIGQKLRNRSRIG